MSVPKVSGSQLNGSKNDNFDGYLIFDFHEFQGLISQPDSNLNEDRSPSESKHIHQARISNPNGMNSSSSVQRYQSNYENPRKFSVYNQAAEDQEDDKKSPALHIQGMDYLDKNKDKTNYDEFYTFLVGLDFLNISNTRNRVDPILMDQFKSLMRIKEYFVMLKNHIDLITENDSDLWFDELKNTFKLMLHQFENMINSISEQINPVSLSVCFFRCVEYIKIFERFLHMRSFHQSNARGEDSPLQKLRRSVQLCFLWRRLTGNKTFDKFINHLEQEPFNCQNCERCKREFKGDLLPDSQQQMQLIGQPSNDIILLQQHQQSENHKLQQISQRNQNFSNIKIYKDIQEGFSKMLDKDLQFLKVSEKKNHQQTIFEQQNNNQQQKESSNEFRLVNRGSSFRNLMTPVCKSTKKGDFFLC